MDVEVLAPQAKPRLSAATGRQKFAITPTRIASGDPGEMLLICAFGKYFSNDRKINPATIPPR
jgi:hypothetical protein